MSRRQNVPIEDIKLAVKHGVKMLDEHGPAGWRQLIDMERFDLGKWDRCVIGQAYGIEPYARVGSVGYDQFVAKIRELFRLDDDLDKEAVLDVAREYGFMPETSYDDLDRIAYTTHEAWLEELEGEQ